MSEVILVLLLKFLLVISHRNRTLDLALELPMTVYPWSIFVHHVLSRVQHLKILVEKGTLEVFCLVELGLS